MTKPSIVPAEALHSGSRNPSWLARLGRRVLFGQLALLQAGEIRLIDGQGEHRFGGRDRECRLVATVHVEQPQFFADAAFGGTVGAGEAYIRGLWRCDDLTALVRILVRNRSVLQGLEGPWASLSRPLQKLFHLMNRNSRAGSARNVAAHYDLGNELYELMLDESMAYSCAIFERDSATLHEAQLAKFDAVCRKLALGPDDHLLEIGTGWGGLAIHAAVHYGCRVTTTTISREQHAYAREKIARLELGERISLVLEDYRDLSGRFDKIVSIEMIEAVGADHMGEYFARASALLKPDGAMLIQAITLQDQLYENALRSVDFVQRYVFPGSFIPSVSAMADAIRQATDMKIVHLEDIGPHYARTLREWRRRFQSSLGRVRQLGFSDSFARLWEFYLCYCEGGFAERQLGDVQILIAKPHWRG
jgi:cyclopropane-fatty-acyl-phospholipid synthase